MTQKQGQEEIIQHQMESKTKQPTTWNEKKLWKTRNWREEKQSKQETCVKGQGAMEDIRKEGMG